MKNAKPIIDAVVIDPPVVYPGEKATITVHARSASGDGPLQITVLASEGLIVPTDQENVFVWHAPPDGPFH